MRRWDSCTIYTSLVTMGAGAFGRRLRRYPGIRRRQGKVIGTI